MNDNEIRAAWYWEWSPNQVFIQGYDDMKDNTDVHRAVVIPAPHAREFAEFARQCILVLGGLTPNDTVKKHIATCDAILKASEESE